MTRNRVKLCLFLGRQVAAVGIGNERTLRALLPRLFCSGGVGQQLRRAFTFDALPAGAPPRFSELGDDARPLARARARRAAHRFARAASVARTASKHANAP